MVLFMALLYFGVSKHVFNLEPPNTVSILSLQNEVCILEPPNLVCFRGSKIWRLQMKQLMSLLYFGVSKLVFYFEPPNQTTFGDSK